MWFQDKLEEKIIIKRKRIKDIVSQYNDQKIGDVTIKNLFSGLRGNDLLVSDVSYVDPNDGIHFRGYSINDLLGMLPKAEDSEMPLAGGMYYLLLIGELPTREEALDIEEEWRRAGDLPYHVADMLRAMPRDTHPMTMFSQAILALQS